MRPDKARPVEWESSGESIESSDADHCYCSTRFPGSEVESIVIAVDGIDEDNGLGIAETVVVAVVLEGALAVAVDGDVDDDGVDGYEVECWSLDIAVGGVGGYADERDSIEIAASIDVDWACLDDGDDDMLEWRC